MHVLLCVWGLTSHCTAWDWKLWQAPALSGFSPEPCAALHGSGAGGPPGRAPGCRPACHLQHARGAFALHASFLPTCLKKGHTTSALAALQQSDQGYHSVDTALLRTRRPMQTRGEGDQADAAGCTRSAPPIIQSQLLECLKSVLYADFPERWPGLVAAISQHLASQARQGLGCRFWGPGSMRSSWALLQACAVPG